MARRISHVPQTRRTLGIETALSWHPYRNQVLLERYRFCSQGYDRCAVDKENGAADIYLVTTPGRPRLRRLTRGGFSGEPAFSPDGRQLVAVRGESVGTRALGGHPDWQPVSAATGFH